MPIHAYHPNLEAPTCESCIYFEVTISQCLPKSVFRIGLVGPDWNPTRPIGSCDGSVAYCNEDGNIAPGSKYDERYFLGPGWGKQGDVIGCGFSQDSIFFTLNGEWIADAPYSVHLGEELRYKLFRTDPYYAAFSTSGPSDLSFNIKGPFHYPIHCSKPGIFLAPHLIERNTISHDDFQMVWNKRIYHSQLPQPQLNTFKRSADIIFPTYSGSGSLALQSSLPLICCQNDRAAIQRGFFYFEVYIISSSTTYSSFFSVGLATRPYPTFHHIGWNKNSVGYHSDDGTVFSGSYSGIDQLSAGFGTGSIIGVGYEPWSETVFFTHDGNRVKSRYNVKGILYPAIACNSDWKISINVGDHPFFFKEANC
jgi:hypothetical protein